LTANFTIDCFFDIFSLKEFPVVLALETRNITFIQADGQLGLSLNSQKKKDIFSLFMKRKIIDTKGFSLVLNSKDDETHRTSFLLFGGSENTILTEKELKYVHFNQKNFSVSINGIEMNGEKALKKGKTKARFDFDKNYIGLPSKALTFLLKKLKGTCDFIGKLIFCSLEESISKSLDFEISFVFSKTLVFSIPLQSLIVCKPISELRLSNYCLLKVREKKNLMIGLPFFEKYEVFFNTEKKSIGFGTTNIQKLRNFVQTKEKAKGMNWEIYFDLAIVLILLLLVVLGFVLKKSVFNYSNIKPVENSLNTIIEQNDRISINSESFIGGDSFHFEYELPEIKKNEAIVNNNIKNEEKLTPITRKHLFDKQQAENEQKEKKEISNIEKIENEKIEDSAEFGGELQKKEREFDEKQGFNSLAEDNDENGKKNEGTNDKNKKIEGIEEIVDKGSVEMKEDFEKINEEMKNSNENEEKKANVENSGE